MVRARLRILSLLLAFPFCIAGVRLAVLQLVGSIHRDSLQESRHISIVPLAPERGRILARGGEVLAGNVPVYDIRFDYSTLNPRDRLVEILADELGERFESFHGRERIEARILELARPEELATRPAPPDVLELVQPEDDDGSSDAEAKRDDKEWIFLIGSIRREAKKRIVGRWNRSRTYHRSYLRFEESADPDYVDLWFSRADIVRQEVVLLRLARLMANGDPGRLQVEYERLVDRVREIRAGYESRIEKDVGPAPRTTDAHAYRSWKSLADTKRWQYHDWDRVLVKNVSLDVVSAVETYAASSFPGLSTGSGSRRVYPQDEVCGSLLGYLGLLDEKEEKRLREARLLVETYFRDQVDFQSFDRVRSELRSRRDRTGASGLERYYDGELRGHYGGTRIQRDRGGVRVLDERPPVDGDDIITTIDLRLQRLLYEELARVSSGTGPLAGNAASAVVMDVETGALLACAGVPSIDPNRMREGGYLDELETRWDARTRSWLWDRPTRIPLAPGSVFKIVVAAAALETAAATGFSPSTTAYPCNYEFPHFKIHCSARNGHGLAQVSLVQALKYSCNIYFYSIGLELLGPRRIGLWADRFGFGRSPGLDLGSGGRAGRLDAADTIEKEGEGVCYYSIGQVHVEATPLQVARSLSLIASGGALARPHLVKPTGPPETVEFSNPDTVGLINDGLWRAAHEAGGTAAGPGLGLGAYRVAVKTGTAEVRRLETRDTVNNAWLAGYAPAGSSSEPRAHPRIAFAVVVEETQGHGAEVCAPAVRRLLRHFASSDPEAYSLDAAGD